MNSYVSLLRVILALSAILLFSSSAWAQPGEFADDLLFSEDELPVIRENLQRPVFSDYWVEVLAADAAEDRNFMREAYIYVLTGDADRGQEAKRLVLEMADQEYWNDFTDGELRLGFLKAGRITSWMALAYDWLYPLFTEEERERIREAIADKGAVPLHRALTGMRYPETVRGWDWAPYAAREPRYNLDMSRWPEILGKNNFRAIINGGLTLATIVLEGHDERTEDWKETVLDSIERFNALLKDDGSYDEAVAYLNYAMTYQIYAMEAAKRHYKEDYYDTANFPGMIDYVLSMYLPTHQYGHGSLTFGDAGNSLLSATSFWVARNGRDGLAQYAGLNYSDHDLMSPLYYDPSVRPVAPRDSDELIELDLDWIVSRDGYEIDDFVVGMRSGGPMNHEHGDRNSIQLKAYGEILLADHRGLTYWRQHPEWEMRRASGHNTVLVNGLGMQYHDGEEGTNESKSEARIVRDGRRPGYHFWASDATQGYRLLNEDVKSVTRTILSFPDAPAVIVLDKVVNETPAVVAARWHVENRDGNGTAATGEDTFVIERPSARLFAATAGNVDQNSSVGTFESDRRDDPFIWVEVADSEPTTESLKLMVGVPLQTGEPDPVVTFERSEKEWTIHVNKTGSVIKVRVLDNGTLPEFEVARNDFR